MAVVRGVVTANFRGNWRDDPPSTWTVAATARMIAAKSKSSSAIAVDGDDGRRRSMTRADTSAGRPTCQCASRSNDAPQMYTPEAVTVAPAVASYSGSRGMRAWMNDPSPSGARVEKCSRSQRIFVADSDDR